MLAHCQLFGVRRNADEDSTLIVDGYRAGLSAAPPTVEDLTAPRPNRATSAEREHYRELDPRMLEQCGKLECPLDPRREVLACLDRARSSIQPCQGQIGSKPKTAA